MTGNEERKKSLLKKFAENKASAAEIGEMLDLLKQSEENPELEILIYQLREEVRHEVVNYPINWERMWKDIQKQRTQSARIKSIYWRKIAVAASVLLAIGLGSYFLFFNQKDNRQEIVKTQQERFKNDVSPGSYKARLMLANGTKIVLDSAMAGELATQGKTVVENKDGQLIYYAQGNTNEILYNTLTTARGETYSMVLADGSKVWLNSASSIKYPVAFTGNERRVEITGEAYFEVAGHVSSPTGGGREGDGKMPFIVKKGDMEVSVLGTHFNVNAYDDEDDIRVTLLEGSVKVTGHRLPVTGNGQPSTILKPGQQAVITRNSTPETRNSVDLDAVIAWKNGRFHFNEANIETVMRQLQKWYDIEVKYESQISQHYIGKIHRDNKISEVLKMLELVGGVHFRIEGRAIIVMK